MGIFKSSAMAIGVSGAILIATAAGAAPPPFEQWLDGLRTEARSRGISEATLSAAFRDVVPLPKVIEWDRSQPEFSETLWTYLDKRVSDRAVEKGREMLATHRPLLTKVAKALGVQPRFLVAFWGMETYYGRYFGKIPTVAALATLAHDERRADFFRAELLALLDLIERGDLPVTVQGSWTGALGHCQFIPTTYRAYAVDFDGDGQANMWQSLPDAFGSAANYLSKSGWDMSKTWGREVKLPPGFDLELADLSKRRKLADWQKLGVRRIEGGPLPRVDIDASVLLPAGIEGPAFLVYKNFRTIMVWNRSALYAIGVGHLTDRIAGAGALRTPRSVAIKPLSRADAAGLQRNLNALGFDVGKPDGIVGPLTRAAIKSFQREARLPADGYAGFGLVERVRLARRNQKR